MPRPHPKSNPRGRSGGRSGGAGYDFQDLYVALQLAKLLVGERDPINEVLWEKKAVERGSGSKPESVHVDDAIIRHRSGTWVYVQLKESAPSGGWSAVQLIKSGVAMQLWRQWLSMPSGERPRTILRLASGGDTKPLELLVDVALRSRTSSELISDEASAEVVSDVQQLAEALSQSIHGVDFLAFLKSIQAEHLPAAEGLETWIINSLVAFGDRARDLNDRLIRLVARSKHIGISACSSHTRESLIAELQREGFPTEALIAAGVLRARPFSDPSFWERYRNRVLEQFRSFRLYGLQVERAAYADLPALFVPLRLAPIPGEQAGETSGREERRQERSLVESLLAQDELRSKEKSYRRSAEGIDLTSLLSAKRRFALVGGPGTGKTTTLKWLAVISALASEEGRQIRLKFGLSAELLIPLYVRFRRFAERIRERGLAGVEGRVGLVADLLAAEFEAGLGGQPLTRTEGLQIAQEMLESSQALFLFDGLDEVPDEAMRSRLFQAVADLVRNFQAPRVIVSSRPYAFRRERCPLELTLYEPLPLDSNERRVFARQWYRSVRSYLGPAVHEKEAQARADALASQAEALADLSGNPLLLSILALVHFNRQGLPVERARLYDYATLAMLGHWERDPTGRDLGDDAIPVDWAPKLQLDEAQIRRAVEYLAYQVQCIHGGGDFSQQVAINALAEGLVSTSPYSIYPAGERALLLLRLLVDRSGLLQERSPGIFAFVHLTFQEYLAARWFVGRGDNGLEELIALAVEERHSEVIRLAVAVLAADQREDADERARTLIVKVGANRPALASACLLEVPRLHINAQIAEELVRAVWTECCYGGYDDYSYHFKRRFRGRGYPPWVAARLVWATLVHTPRADNLLLEFVSQSSGQDHPYHFEPSLELLIQRPPVPLTPKLAWILRRLVQAKNKGPFGIALFDICALLLVEGGSENPEDHFSSLVRLLRRTEWDYRGRAAGSTLSSRAERILAELGVREKTAGKVRSALEAELLGSAANNGSWRAARVLLSLGGLKKAKLVTAAVQRGLSSYPPPQDLVEQLRSLVQSLDTRQAALSALENGLTSKDRSFRQSCVEILRDLGCSDLAETTDECDDSADRVRQLGRLLTDPAKSEQTMKVLADELLDEKDNVAWEAASSLLESGHFEMPGIAQVLVRVGLGSEGWRSGAAKYLKEMRRDPRLDLAVRATLLDGLHSGSDVIATASAVSLLDLGEARGGERLARVIRASIRDASQIREVLPHIERLLLDESAKPTILEVIGRYFAKEGMDEEVASPVARRLAQAGHLSTSNLARGLVLGALSKSEDHEEVIGFLKQMLDDRQLATETREGLSQGLKSDDSTVAWGSVRCLWEAGSWTDPEFASTIIRAGLSEAGRREQARAWLLELLRQPRTARGTRQALEGKGEFLLASYKSKHETDYDLAWEIAVCLTKANALHAEFLAEALVHGGLSRRERHAEVLSILQGFMEPQGELTEEIEKELWDALDSSEQSISWGAARTLIVIGKVTLSSLEHKGTNSKNNRLMLLIQVLLRETEDQKAASEHLARLIQDSDLGSHVRGALVRLLDFGGEAFSNEASIAYAAAHSLISIGEKEHFALAHVLVKAGLTVLSHSQEAARTLDELKQHPWMATAVNEALNRAAWGSDLPAAWSAAIYMMDRGMCMNPGVSRGLVFAGLLPHEPEAESRLLRLLADPNSRSSTMDMLNASLYGEYECFHVASLLIRTGAEIHDRLVMKLAQGHESRPVGVLALLALSGRGNEVRSRAQRLGLSKLVDLIGDEPVP